MKSQEPIIAMKELTRSVKQAVENKQIGHQSPIEQKWEELEEIFQHSAEAILTTASSVNEALNIPGIKEKITNVAEMNIAVNGLNADLQAFTSTLAAIHERHQHCTGPIVGEKDLIRSINIFEDYVAFNTKFKAVTLPTVITIMDQIGIAAERYVNSQPTNSEKVTIEGQATHE